MHFVINKVKEYDSLCVSKKLMALRIYIHHRQDATLVISWTHFNRSLYTEKHL